MPDFEPKKRKPKPTDDLPVIRQTQPEKFESRCHICTSSFRKSIERMVALGRPYAEISRTFSTEEHNVDRRSIKKHAEEHLPYEEAAIRRIIEKEAEEAKIDLEQGVEAILNRRIFLSALIQRSVESLINGDMPVEARDTLAAIQLQDKMDSQVEGAAIDELRLQFNAFVQSIQESVSPDVWHTIMNRTKEILGRNAPTGQLESPPE